MHDNTLWIIVIALMLAIVAVIGSTISSRGSPACMTEREARVKWPSDHLWWHGPDRCWDNSRASPRPVVKKNPLNIPREPVPVIIDDTDPNGNKASTQPPAATAALPDPLPKPSILYPTLVDGKDIDPMMARAEPITQWPPIIDIDDDKPPLDIRDPNDFNEIDAQAELTHETMHESGWPESPYRTKHVVAVFIFIATFVISLVAALSSTVFRAAGLHAK